MTSPRKAVWTSRMRSAGHAFVGAVLATLRRPAPTDQPAIARSASASQSGFASSISITGMSSMIGYSRRQASQARPRAGGVDRDRLLALGAREYVEQLLTDGHHYLLRRGARAARRL